MKQRGFTLLELMIVVAIIMILGGGGLWAMNGRIQKNEIIRMKSEIPTLIKSSTLRIYERATSGAAISVTTDKISISEVGSSAEYKAKTSMFSFSISPSAITGSGITIDGAFKQNFDIIVSDVKTSQKILTFSIKTKENLGVYSLSVTQSSF